MCPAAAALLTASVPSFCYDSRPRLLPHHNVPAAFSAVLPSFGKSRQQVLTNYIRQAQTPLVSLNYVPNTIASLNIPDSNERLLAAGGQDAELHLSIHSRHTSPRSSSDLPSHGSRRLWQYDGVLSGSINNSVLLTSLSLTRSNESSAEPRVAVSNNDCTVKVFDVSSAGRQGCRWSSQADQ